MICTLNLSQVRQKNKQIGHRLMVCRYFWQPERGLVSKGVGYVPLLVRVSKAWGAVCLATIGAFGRYSAGYPSVPIVRVAI